MKKKIVHFDINALPYHVVYETECGIDYLNHQKIKSTSIWRKVTCKNCLRAKGKKKKS